MGLDICRFVEVRRNGHWERVICGEEYSLLCQRNNAVGEEYARLTEEMKHKAVTFGYGSSMADIIEDCTMFHFGFPEDTTEKELYDSWGYSPHYLSLEELCNLISYERKLLHGKLKNVKLEKPSFFDRFKKQKPYYPRYEWNDETVEDKFDDEFFCGMEKISKLEADYNQARAIVDICYPNDYILENEIRIIYVFNR